MASAGKFGTFSEYGSYASWHQAENPEGFTFHLTTPVPNGQGPHAILFSRLFSLRCTVTLLRERIPSARKRVGVTEGETVHEI
jgi:hypothetical protein